MFKITLLNGKSFTPKAESETILDAAIDNKLTLDYSCKNGRCGVCKTKVIKGETDIIRSEISLSQLEKDEGYILTCCRSATSELWLEAEDIDGLVPIECRTIPCKIDSIEKITDDLISVVLRSPPKMALEFCSGQYINIIAKSGIRRSYSIANGARVDGKIELNIRKFNNGIMSKYWFEECKLNDLLYLEGPFGTFTYRNNAKKEAIFLATGTGIAPVKSILEDLDSKNLNISQIKVYWGMRSENEIYWQPNFKNLSVKFIPVISRPNNTWKGDTGYVQNLMIADNFDVDNSSIYACGSPSMISDAKIKIQAAGFDMKYFYSDAFWESN